MFSNSWLFAAVRRRASSSAASFASARFAVVGGRGKGTVTTAGRCVPASSLKVEVHTSKADN